MTGKEIKDKRKAKGWTQKGLADFLGVHRVTVTRWETDDRKPHPVIMRFLGSLAEGVGNASHAEEATEAEGIKMNCDTFVKYCDDIEEYAFAIGRKDDDAQLVRMYNALQRLSYKVETILKDLGYKV